jgi:allophanate hydrolase subunit 2
LKIAKNATLQDAGRIGFRHFGVPDAGPFDWFSAEASNIAVGNESGTAVLELHAPGAEFETTESCRIALYGALTDIRINEDLVLGFHRHFQLKMGCRVEISRFRKGARLYLALEGGFEAQKTLGSVCGTVVEPGDVFQSASRAPFSEPRFPFLNWDFDTPIQLPIIPSGVTAFDFGAIDNLVVSHLSDRSGIRLEGNIPRHSLRPISQPICAGAVQWTPSGELIVIGPDGPTIGGYPWIGTIPKFALFRLAQATMKDPVVLRSTSWEEAYSDHLKIKPGWTFRYAP